MNAGRDECVVPCAVNVQPTRAADHANRIDVAAHSLVDALVRRRRLSALAHD